MQKPADRRALQSVAAQFFVNGAILSSFIPRFPEIREQVGVSLAGLGLIMTASGAFGLLGSLLVSTVIARFGTRRAIIGGGILITSCLPLIGVATNPLVLFVALAGFSTFDVIVDVPMNMQGSWISGRRSHPVMNRLHGLWSLGTVTGGVAASRLAAAGVSVRTHFFLATAVLLLVLVFVGRGLLTDDEIPAEAGEAHAEVDAHKAKTQRRANRGALAMFGLAGGTAVAIEMVSGDWSAFRLTEDFGATPGFAGLAFVANTGGMTLSRMAGDWIESKLGEFRLLRAAIAVAAIGLLLASLAPNEALTLVGYLLAGLGMAPFLPRLYDRAVKLPGRPGAGVGALTAGVRISALATPIIVGALAASPLSVGQATALVTLPAILAFAALTARRPDQAQA